MLRFTYAIRRNSGVNNRSHFSSFLSATLALPSHERGTTGAGDQITLWKSTTATANTLSASNQEAGIRSLQTLQFPLHMPIS